MSGLEHPLFWGRRWRIVQIRGEVSPYQGPLDVHSYCTTFVEKFASLEKRRGLSNAPAPEDGVKADARDLSAELADTDDGKRTGSVSFRPFAIVGRCWLQDEAKLTPATVARRLHRPLSAEQRRLRCRGHDSDAR
jgi:hypothetical protein